MSGARLLSEKIADLASRNRQPVCHRTRYDYGSGSVCRRGKRLVCEGPLFGAEEGGHVTERVRDLSIDQSSRVAS